MRIITGAISHETSTWQSYRKRFGYLRGEGILTSFRDTNTPMGGFIEGADAHGFERIATVFAADGDDIRDFPRFFDRGAGHTGPDSVYFYPSHLITGGGSKCNLRRFQL